MFDRINIKGILAIIIIVVGYYVLAFNNSTSDIKIAVVGLMSAVIGYYFGNSEKTKSNENLKDK